MKIALTQVCVMYHKLNIIYTSSLSWIYSRQSYVMLNYSLRHGTAMWTAEVVFGAFTFSSNLGYSSIEIFMRHETVNVPMKIYLAVSFFAYSLNRNQ